MEPRYKHWKVGSTTRPEIDWDEKGMPFRTGATETVVIIEADEETFRAVMDRRTGGGWILREFTLRAHEVTPALLRSVPLSWIRDTAAGYLSNLDSHMADGMDSATAALLSEQEPGEVDLNDARPSLQEFARVWREEPGHTFTPEGRVSRRKTLSDRYHVSVWTVDKWVKAARDAGLIEAASVGRPRRKPSTATPEEER